MRIGKLHIGRAQCIYLQPINGLGNRLRTIQSLYKLAVHTGRKLKIYWGPGEGFSTEAFDELFSTRGIDYNVIEFITEVEFFAARKRHLCIDAFVRQGTDYKYYVRDKEKVINTLLSKSFCLTTSSCIEFMFNSTQELKDIYSIYKYNCWVSKLQPQKNILEKIQKVVSKFDKNTIGLHIRKGDAAIGPHKNFYAVSKDELFYEHIRKHNGKVFIATDCKYTQEDLIRTFGDKIITYEDKTFIPETITITDEKPNQADAVVDMYCLAATQKLYGTNWSTFSVISAELSGIPITKVGTGKDKKEKIGIVTAAMNRESMLKVSLASWLNCSEVSEIVIVDWCSKNSLTYLEKLDPRVRVIRVENQKYFNLGKAYNLAFNESTCDKILKLDVDYILNPYCNIFKSGVQLNKKNFITGNWRDAKLDNKIGFLSHLNGFVYLYRDSFFHAGGYSKFDGYGWDDDDLYNKLEKVGYVRDFIKLSSSGKPYIYHNPHDDSFRSENYKEKDIKKSAKINRETSHKRNK